MQKSGDFRAVSASQVWEWLANDSKQSGGKISGKKFLSAINNTKNRKIFDYFFNMSA